MSRYYSDFTYKDLENVKEIILKHLNKIYPYIKLLDGFRSIKSYLPIISFIIIEKNLTEKQIEEFFIKIKDSNYRGRGDDLNPSELTERYSALTKSF